MLILILSNVKVPADEDGTVCSDVETINKIFDDKVDESTFETDASTFAEIVTEQQAGNGVDASIFSWTFYAR